MKLFSAQVPKSRITVAFFAVASYQSQHAFRRFLNRGFEQLSWPTATATLTATSTTTSMYDVALIGKNENKKVETFVFCYASDEDDRMTDSCVVTP